MLFYRLLARNARSEGLRSPFRSYRPSFSSPVRLRRTNTTNAVSDGATAAKHRNHPPPPEKWIEAPKNRFAGPIMERNQYRKLPPLPNKRRLLISIPIFLSVLAAAAAVLFNYQRSSSSVVYSTIYALRTHPIAREILGDEIAFASAMPWIHGTLDLLHGRIDVSWYVKGTKRQGLVRLEAIRIGGKAGLFTTREWSLTTEEGATVDLLDRNEDPAALARGDVTLGVER